MYHATKRKTREQKIQASQRKGQTRQAAQNAQAKMQHAEKGGQNPHTSHTIAQNPEPAPGIRYQLPATDNSSAVMSDLRQITWISLVCLGLLLIATILLSPFSIFAQLRQMLNLPTL